LNSEGIPLSFQVTESSTTFGFTRKKEVTNCNIN
jgi:hypothetical protein